MKRFAFGHDLKIFNPDNRPVIGAKIHDPDRFKRLVLDHLTSLQPKLSEDPEDPGVATARAPHSHPYGRRDRTGPITAAPSRSGR
ncbi:MAG: hypothetical protein UY72_C0064G0002 [Candidatus Uhrbacteria bacterium GW2011_GWD2_52_7]|uniref:Uncharacterized protein n=1 Tax=Candidatus Uhrbacteria bacterium GW2011_GWD2_52_7 TaxID=1618989 RepID=A0A0G2A8N1_9BACT|nr:MAG: hypothetical protein UY72_C0064G0002 [Candidatus Uhrbacteria bacterium GW2011_GWD2_52_7]